MSNDRLVRLPSSYLAFDMKFPQSGKWGPSFFGEISYQMPVMTMSATIWHKIPFLICGPAFIVVCCHSQFLKNGENSYQIPVDKNYCKGKIHVKSQLIKTIVKGKIHEKSQLIKTIEKGKIYVKSQLIKNYCKGENSCEIPVNKKLLIFLQVSGYLIWKSKAQWGWVCRVDQKCRRRRERLCELRRIYEVISWQKINIFCFFIFLLLLHKVEFCLFWQLITFLIGFSSN